MLTNQKTKQLIRNCQWNCIEKIYCQQPTTIPCGLRMIGKHALFKYHEEIFYFFLKKCEEAANIRARKEISTSTYIVSFHKIFIIKSFHKTFCPGFEQKSHYKNIASVISRLRMNLAKINQTGDNTANTHAANNK